MSHERRDLIEHLLVRAPAITYLLATGLRRVPQGSLLRRCWVVWLTRRSFAAMARSDTEAMLIPYERDAEIWIFGLEGVGVDRFYSGHGIQELMSDLDEAFSDWRWTPRAVVDGGDRVAVRTDFVAHGRASQVKTAITNGGTAIGLSRRGKIAWQE